MAGLASARMNGQRLLGAIDHVSYWSGKAFAWLIVALTFVVSIEVFKRYILNAPTAWIFDLNSMLYGTLFMMCGAYTLAAAGHVRADFVYIYMKPRGQAALDLALYLLFFVPCMIGLIYAGGGFAADSWRIQYVDEESRRAAMQAAHAIDEAARHRSVMEEGLIHERAVKEDERKDSCATRRSA